MIKSILQRRQGKYRNKYFFLLISLSFAFYALQLHTHWRLISRFGMKGPKDFGDLRIILSAAKCGKNLGLQIYEYQSGTCVYNYGDALIKILNFLHLDNPAYTQAIAYFLIISVIFSFCFLILEVSEKFRFQNLVVALMLICSPPVWLLFERGNLDTLMFVLVTMTMALYIFNFRLLGNIVLTISVLIKFYTLPNIFFKLHKDRNRLYMLSSLTFFSIATIWVSIDLQKIYSGFSIPNPTYCAYGSPIVGLVLNKLFHFHISKNLQLLLGLIILLLGVLAAEKLSEKLNSIKEFRTKLNNLSKNTFYIYKNFAIIYFFTFFTSMSFVYRLIFLLPVLYIFIVCAKFNFMNSLILLFSIWISFEFYLFEIIGDALLFIIAIGIVWLAIPDNFFRFLKNYSRKSNL